MQALAAFNHRVKRFSAYKAAKNSPSIDIIRTADGFFMPKTGKRYKFSSTAKNFHLSSSLVRAVMGPVGSGKSTMCCAEPILTAMDADPCKDGVRRSRWLIVRNTYGQLKTTTLATWMSWWGKLGDAKLTYDAPIKFKTTFSDDKGRIELEVYFLALDRVEDKEKLDSYEFNGAYINEARYMPGDEDKGCILLETIKERIGRYPAVSDLLNGQDGVRKYIIMDTNPPSARSWFYKLFEKDKPQGYELFRQPSGLISEDGIYKTNPLAENIENLPPSYYLDNAIGKTEEHIKVQLMGEYGVYMEGERVYQCYNDDIHSTDKPLNAVAGVPLLLGWDYGNTPACIIGQHLPNGQLILIKEFWADNMDVKQFAEDIVKPHLDMYYSAFDIISVGDPSGNALLPSGHTTHDILTRAGIKTTSASSNMPVTRLGAVINYMTKLVDGKPAFLFSRQNLPMVREGFLGGYQMHLVSGEKKPLKNEFSHTQDAVQYLCLAASKPYGISDKKSLSACGGTVRGQW